MLSLADPCAGTTIEELLTDLVRVRVRGRRMRYSNFGAALLGQALAARAGTTYEELVEARVLRPLGVEEIWAHGAPSVAQPHDRRGGPVPAWDLGAYAPAGCLRGTARGTHGSRAFTAFVPATGAAIAIVTNSPKAPDPLARRLLAA